MIELKELVKRLGDCQTRLAGETLCPMAVLLYLKAVLFRWWTLMSCAVFTIIGLYATYANKDGAWILRNSLIAAVGLFGVAGFFAWNEEHKARVSAEQKFKDEEPKLMFGAVPEFDESNLESWGEYVFSLKNYGRRPARYAHIEPLKSIGEQYTLAFEDSDIVPAGSLNHVIAHEIDDGTRKTVLYKRSLWDFLHNGPAEQRMTEFDVIINFKDMQEQKQKVVHMRFDKEKKRRD